MTYTKAQVVSFPDALSVIQACCPLRKWLWPALDMNFGFQQKLTIQAYEGDE